MAERLDYVNYDFDDLVQQLIDRVSSRDAWTDTYRSSTGQMLIELYAYVANLVLYYVERRAEESYIETARNRSSVINLVRLLNYIPKLRTAASGVLTFSITSPHTKNIYIPKYTECQTAGKVTYVVSEDVVLLAGSTSVTANAKQGVLITQSSVSGGVANAEYPINDTDIEDGSLIVKVNNTEWTLVSSFLTSRPSDEVYRLRYELDDTLTPIFGDGQKGKIPPTGDQIDLEYIRTDGISGNVYQADAIHILNSIIYDEDAARVDVTVTNTGIFLGGDEREDTEEIRYEAPRVFSTGDRAVTKDDYIAILENYAGVANANVWGENEETPPNYDMFNRVKLAILLQDWTIPTDTWEDTLTEYLYTKSQITVKYEYIDAVILQVIPTISIKVAQGNVLSQIQDNVETTLAAQFELGITTKLGIAKRISDLVEKVDNTTGVAYHHLILKVLKCLSAGFDSYHDYGEVLDAVPLLPESVEVYVGTSLISVDDGNGSFTTSSTGYVVSGTVDYVTGVVGVDITPSPSADVCIRYRQDSDGDIEVTNKQICKLYSVDVVGISYSS